MCRCGVSVWYVCLCACLVAANLVPGRPHLHLSLLNPRHDFHHHCSQGCHVGADGRFAHAERVRGRKRKEGQEEEREEQMGQKRGE